jgi:hypothetical protein
MYVPHQMLRVNHDEWLRHAEVRRQIKQAAAESRASAQAAGRGRRELGFLRGRGLRRPVSPA